VNAHDVLFFEKQRLSLAGWVLSVVRDMGMPPGINRMTTVVTPRYLNVHEGPRTYETWRIEDITGSEPVYKSSKRDESLDGRVTRFTIRGDEGVLVTLDTGRQVFVGSGRPAELHAAIHRARSEGPLYREG
jgi:hypothetical protein